MFTSEHYVNLTTFMNTLQNIIAIDCVPVKSITGYERISELFAQVDDRTPWQSLPIKVPAQMKISDKIEDGVRIYTAQLVFRTCEERMDLKRLAYRCCTASGKYLLIGTPERPYPVSTVTQNHPDNMTDNQLDEVTVSYTSTTRIPYIY